MLYDWHAVLGEYSKVKFHYIIRAWDGVMLSYQLRNSERVLLRWETVRRHYGSGNTSAWLQDTAAVLWSCSFSFIFVANRVAYKEVQWWSLCDVMFLVYHMKYNYMAVADIFCFQGRPTCAPHTGCGPLNVFCWPHMVPCIWYRVFNPYNNFQMLFVTGMFQKVWLSCIKCSVCNISHRMPKK